MTSAAMKFLLIVLSLPAALVASACGGGESAPDRIVFGSDRDGNPEIYVMNADGSAVTRLTENSGLDGTPSWSPDGQRIAFFSVRDGLSGVYTMNADGSEVTPIVTGRISPFPAWSPEGRRIAFTARHDSVGDIYVASLDGSYETRLTRNRFVLS